MKDKYFVDATMLMYAHDIAAVAEHDRREGPCRARCGRGDGTPLVALVLADGPEAWSISSFVGRRLGPQTIDGNCRALTAAANIP
jgi:hypothetical protein